MKAASCGCGAVVLLLTLEVLALLGLSCLLNHCIQLLLGHLDDRKFTHLRVTYDSGLWQELLLDAIELVLGAALRMGGISTIDIYEERNKGCRRLLLLVLVRIHVLKTSTVSVVNFSTTLARVCRCSCCII